jgi:hypothetical protein
MQLERCVQKRHKNEQKTGRCQPMKYRELEYSRTNNLGNYESERITLKVELDETEDLDESYKTLKATVFRLQKEGGLIEDSKKVVEADKRLETVKKAFPQDLANLLIFEESKNTIIIKPKEFLGSKNFARIAAVVRELKGEYISAGKESHFKIPKKS